MLCTSYKIKIKVYTNKFYLIYFLRIICISYSYLKENYLNDILVIKYYYFLYICIVPVVV